jgi:hypothetical protein
LIGAEGHRNIGLKECNSSKDNFGGNLENRMNLVVRLLRGNENVSAPAAAPCLNRRMISVFQPGPVGVAQRNFSKGAARFCAQKLRKIS